MKYPEQPGFKTGGTSREAAEKMGSEAPTLRDQCFNVLKEGPATADEVAAKLERNILGVRPRLSELAALGMIEETGKRRQNESGMSANEWRVRQSEELFNFKYNPHTEQEETR